MVGVWLIVLASSSTPYGKVLRLILKKTSRRTQAVVVSEGIFCAARCVIFYLQSMKVYLHMSNGNVQRNRFMPIILSLRIFTSPPGSRLLFFIKMQIECSYYNSTLLDSTIIRLYPQNPVSKIVHDESVKIVKHSKQKQHTQHVSTDSA